MVMPVAPSSFIHVKAARGPPAIDLPSPPVSKFKIGLCLMTVTANKERNIAHARLVIKEAAEQGAKLVVLPEIWNSPYSNDSFPVYAEDIDAGTDASPSTAMLSDVARSLNVTIVGGSITERCGDKLYNTCCVFGTDGKLKAKHRKIHLFDISILPGEIVLEESGTITAGWTPTVVDTDVGRIGIGISHDMCYPELAMIYAARGAHLLCYPGTFNMTSGPLPWESLQRARAADNQLYVATCSPFRQAGAVYKAMGHSTLVGPLGEILSTAVPEPDEVTIISEIDYSLVDQRRKNLPLQMQRRSDLYSLVDVQRHANPSMQQAALSRRSREEKKMNPWLVGDSSVKRKKTDSSNKRSTKSKTSSFVEKLDVVLDALSAKSTETLTPNSSSPTILDCMNIVTAFPDFNEGSLKYSQAIITFRKRHNREAFMCPTTDEAKMEILKLLLQE